jgi:hypothetical protein
MDITELFDFAVTDSDGGYEVTMTPRDGLSVVVCDNHVDSVAMRLRDVDLPRIGQRVSVGEGAAQRIAKVERIEFDETGTVTIVDDMGIRHKWA